jgi:tetratricopeptide (TPR) repeat protein
MGRAAVLGAALVGLLGCGGSQREAGGGQAAGAGVVATTSGASVSPTATGAGDAGVADAGGGAGDAGFVPPTGPQAQQISRLFNEGSAAFSRGDFPAAARAFRQAYDLNPTGEMAFNLARVYDRMGEVAEAIRFYELVLRGGPEAEQRAFIEGRIAALRAYEQRRREGIAQAPASAAELNEEGLRWFQNGVRFFGRRQYRQALIAFEQAALHLQTPELYFNLGMTHERLGHIDQAIEFLREYLDTRRGTPEEAEIQRHIEQLEQRR